MKIREFRGGGRALVGTALGASTWLGCGSKAQDQACPAHADLMIAASVESLSSVVGLASLDGGAEYLGGDPLGGDPALTSSAGRVFWLNRASGQVLELDPTCATQIRTWSANDDVDGGSTDPQDVAVAPDGSLWVARFYVSTLLVKSSDGSTELGSIDLSHVAGVNRNPFMSSIRIVDSGQGAKAYVTLEMLDPATEQSTSPSYLVRLDVATALQTGEVEATLELKGRNPFGLIVQGEGGTLYLADLGKIDADNETTAGIERVDLATFTSELIVREADIGAKVAQVSITSGCGSAIVFAANETNNTSVITFDPTSGAIVTPLSEKLLYTPGGYKLSGMAWLPGGLNVIGAGTAVSGKGYPVHVLSRKGGCSLEETGRSLYAPDPPITLLPLPPP